MTRAIIIAAGKGERWGNHRGVEKHLVTIDGVRLLDQTAGLLAEHTEDIHIVGLDSRYDNHNSILHVLSDEERWPTGTDADKFLSSQFLWHPSERTVVLYGDVYFTEEAMDRIMRIRAGWTLYCRFRGSQITGGRWGECWAQGFWPEDIDEHLAALHRIADLYKRGVINRCGGWEHYRAMCGKPDAEIRRPHGNFGRAVEINDATEDFDYPADYEIWLERTGKTP